MGQRTSHLAPTISRTTQRKEAQSNAQKRANKSSQTKKKSSSTFQSPIANLPPEILRVIFEMVVGTGKKGRNQAAVLSQVSGYWRAIALDTPKLWSYMKCSMLWPKSKLEMYWDERPKRIKNCPAIITIRDIGRPESRHLAELKLDQVHTIRSLTLQGDSWDNFDQFLSSTFSPPTAPILCLSIQTKIPTGSEWLETAILGRFPPVKKLCLSGCARSFAIHPALGHVCALRLDDLTDLYSLNYFTNLASLEIVNPWNHDSGISIIVTLPKLHTFKMERPPRWLSQLTCPNLSVLFMAIFHGYYYNNDQRIFAWLQSHPTIKTLHTHRAPRSQYIYDALPQLENLFVTQVDQTFDVLQFKAPRFPVLKTLTLSDWTGRLNLLMFDDLVTERCLSVLDERCQLPPNIQPLERLEIITEWPRSHEEGWRRSGLYSEAHSCRVVDYEEEEEDNWYWNESKACVLTSLSWT